MLDNAYTFLPFFYFGMLSEAGECLVISDHPERQHIEYALLNQNIRFAIAGGSQSVKGENDSIKAQLAALKSVDSRFDLIVFDITGEKFEHHSKTVFELLKPGGVAVIADWRGGKSLTIKQKVRHWRHSDPEYLLNASGVIRDDNWRPEWYLLLEPDLKKPRYFVAPGFRTSIPAGSESPVKRWLIRKGAFYLQAHPRLLAISRPTGNSEHPAAFIDRVMAGVLQRPPSPELRRLIRQFYISTTNILILHIRDVQQDYFIRFPFTKAAVQRLQNQDTLLRKLRKKGIDYIPHPAETIAEKIPVFAETAVAGRGFEKEFAEQKLALAENYYSQAQDKIRQVHQAFGETVVYDETIHTRHLEPRLQRIAGVLPEHTQMIHAIGNAMLAILHGKRILLTLCHGDFKIGNCLFYHSQQISGIIDWDMGETEAPALLDIAGLWGKSIRHRHRLSLAELVLGAEKLPADFWHIYQRYFRETGTDEIPRYPAMLYYWIDRVYKQIAFDTHLGKSWINNNIIPVIRHFSKHTPEQIQSHLFNL